MKKLKRTDNVPVDPTTTPGDDSVFGGQGSDTVLGGGGEDVVDGGPRGFGDTDVLTGGEGADLFLLSYDKPPKGADAGSGFWTTWSAGLASSASGPALASAIRDVFFDGRDVAGGVALGSVGSILGPDVDALVDFLGNLAASQAPADPGDMVVFTDFDPSEDVLVSSVAASVDLDYSIEYRTSLAGTSGWALAIRDRETVYAQVFLDAAFLQSLGLEDDPSSNVAALAAQVTGRTMTMGPDGSLDDLGPGDVLAGLPGGGWTGSRTCRSCPRAPPSRSSAPSAPSSPTGRPKPPLTGLRPSGRHGRTPCRSTERSSIPTPSAPAIRRTRARRSSATAATTSSRERSRRTS